jgi:peptidoglycan-associated lipoprotein
MTRRSASPARTLVLGAVAALTLAGACRRRPAAAPTPVNPAPSAADEDARRRRDSLDAAQRARALRDSADLASQQAGARGEQARRDSAAASARSALLAPVYFDYDASELRDDTREALEAKLPLLTRYAGLRLRVAGHTDDRGADEYNLALGQRRAAAVKRFFSERGIDASRITIVSFGKERSTCAEEAESCWSRNRRAEFEVTGGGEALGAGNGR